jgi:hypothetical protein
LGNLSFLKLLIQTLSQNFSLVSSGWTPSNCDNTHKAKTTDILWPETSLRHRTWSPQLTAHRLQLFPLRSTSH